MPDNVGFYATYHLRISPAFPIPASLLHSNLSVEPPWESWGRYEAMTGNLPNLAREACAAKAVEQTLVSFRASRWRRSANLV